MKTVRRNSPIQEYNYVGLWTMQVDTCKVLDWSDPEYRLRADIPKQSTRSGSVGGGSAGGGSSRGGASGSVFRVSFSDPSGAAIDMEVPMQREFVNVRPGDEAVGVVVSDVATLERFKCLRDVFLPQTGCWVSEYPFIERAALLRILRFIEDQP